MQERKTANEKKEKRASKSELKHRDQTKRGTVSKRREKCHEMKDEKYRS